MPMDIINQMGKSAINMRSSLNDEMDIHEAAVKYYGIFYKETYDRVVSFEEAKKIVGPEMAIKQLNDLKEGIRQGGMDSFINYINQIK